MYRLLSSLTVLCFFLAGCATDPILPTEENNPDLLFPNALPLSIQQDPESPDIRFLLGTNVGAFTHIGIYTSPPSLVDGQVISDDPALWEYLGATSANQSVPLSSGTFRDGLVTLGSDFFLCREDPVYYAAWSWEETAQFVRFATAPDRIIVSSPEQPELILAGVRRVGETPGDTLNRAGTETTLRLSFRNTGTLTARAASVTLLQTDFEELPVTLELGDVAPGETVTQTITVTIPEDALFGQEYLVNITAQSNQCVRSTAEFSVVVNSLNVFLTDIRLKTINYLPPLILWDPGGIFPSFYPPDVYYFLYAPNNVLLLNSIVIPDASNDQISTPDLADWPNLTPPLQLVPDSLYRVDIIDEDLVDDDFIGSVGLRASDYILTQDSIVIIENEEVTVEFHLRWE